MGIVGIVFVGPQNWLLRVVREGKTGRLPDDFDTLIRKKKSKRIDEMDEVPFYFSSQAPDNRPVRNDHIDTSDCKEVAVPYSQLQYRRFYDWPPEPEYARVWKCEEPMNDPIAEQILEDDAFELYDGSCGDDATEQGIGWKRRARGIVKGVTRRSPKVKNLRRRTKQLETLQETTDDVLSS